jgi:5-methylthioadenosine/S-adenosylhomocysteine deaminase
MEPVDALIHARWVLPVEPYGVVHEHHALALRAGRIVDSLPSEQARERYEPVQDLEFPQHALMPGLVNTHTHAPMTLLRGLADDLPLMTWLQEHIWPAERRWVDPEFVRDGSRLAMAEMLRGGITCFNDMYFYGEETARAAAEAGMRAMVGLIVLDFPHPFAKDAEEYLSKGLALHDEFRHHPLVRTAFAPHAPYSVSDAPLGRVATLAEELDLPVHMHVHETADEISESLHRHGQRPLARLQRLGLVSPRLLAVHVTQVSDEEIGLLAEAGCQVLHCPESNLKLAAGFCPAARLQAAGVNVALGTDGAASNNDLDMFGEMRTAALVAKAVAGDPSALPAHEVLRMGTLNGARALGWEQEIGTLEPGKAADIVAVRLGDLETQPVYHVASQLVYATGREKVTDVWVAGRQVLKGRRLTTLEEDEVLRLSAKWQMRIARHESRT